MSPKPKTEASMFAVGVLTNYGLDPVKAVAAAAAIEARAAEAERARLRKKAEALVGSRYGSSLATPEVYKDDVLEIFEETK